MGAGVFPQCRTLLSVSVASPWCYCLLCPFLIHSPSLRLVRVNIFYILSCIYLFDVSFVSFFFCPLHSFHCYFLCSCLQCVHHSESLCVCHCVFLSASHSLHFSSPQFVQPSSTKLVVFTFLSPLHRDTQCCCVGGILLPRV